MKKKRWLIVAILVIVVAAAAAAAYLWFGRGTSSTVHYLTAQVTKGTISQTVSADFTLNSATGMTSIALGGGAASDSSTSSSSSSSSTDTTTTTTSSLQSTTSLASAQVPASSHGSGAAMTTFAALATAPTTTIHADAVLPAADDSGSPSPSPSPTATPTPSPTATPTPTPTPTRTTTPRPSPSPSVTTFPSGSSGGSSLSGGSVSGSGSGASTGASTSSTSTSSSTYSGVVTRLVRPAGATPETLQKLLYVSGKPVFAFVSPMPLWKNLSTSLPSGAQRVNVAALQKALKKQAYYKKAINGNFTSATKKAFKRWQKANGMSATGVLGVTRFVWMPTGSVLTAWSVNLGSHVSSGTALASVVSPSRLSASALISQADIADLKVGQKAQMTVDGYDSDAFTGRIGFISSEPASSSSTSSSSTSTQYSITVAPQDLPNLAKSGMTGTLDIVIQQAADVLMVPTTAVSGSSTTSSVRVMQDGQPVLRQVQTGMATSSYTEITSGLAEGETVVTGQYTEGADASSSSSQTNPGGLLQGGGGFPSGGGFPGGGAPPAGGGGDQ